MKKKHILAIGIMIYGAFIPAISLAESVSEVMEDPDETVNEQIFTDIDASHEKFEAIKYLLDHYIIKGYDDGSFQPERTVNRAEALKIILLGANYHLTETIAAQSATNDAEMQYPDVPLDAWYFPYIDKATKLDIVSGYPDGYFRPENTVNMAETLKMIIKANNIEPRTDFDGQPFNDVPADSWYAHYAQFFKDYYLLTEDENGNIYADQEINRGNLCQLMYGFIMRERFREEGLEAEDKARFIYGKASFYGGGDGFNGRTTANGEIFDDTKFTAAHLSISFDTWIRVYFLEDLSKYIEVRINDRGPYDDRLILDLSAAAFEEFAPISRGIIDIKYEIIDEPEVDKSR